MQRNIPMAKYQPICCSKQMAQKIRQADREADQEAVRQVDILYHAAAIALYRYHDWRLERISKFVKVSEGAYFDCAASNDISMVEMCWNEIGIELMSADRKQRWFEVEFLNSEIETGKAYDQFRYLAMRRSEKQWIGAQITASILIALYRKEGWGAVRCGRFFEELEGIKIEYGYDTEKLKKASLEITGFELIDEIQFEPMKE